MEQRLRKGKMRMKLPPREITTVLTPSSRLPLPRSKGDNKSSPVSFQPGTFSLLCHF